MIDNFRIYKSFELLSLEQRLLYINEAKAWWRGRYDIAFFARYHLGIELNPFQERVLQKTFEHGETHFYNLIIAGNRTGKSVLLAVLHIWFNYYKVGITLGQGWEKAQYNTFDLSPVYRQARNVLDTIESILRSSFSWEVDGLRKRNKCLIENFLPTKNSINRTTGEVKFSNHSRFYAMSTGQDASASTQGSSAGYISYDECVQSHHLEEELGARINSRLGDYGQRLDLVSTPDDQAPSQQYFYHLYTEARNAEKYKKESIWKLVTGNFEENIFISHKQRIKFIQSQKKLNPALASQVLKGAFVETGTKFFDNMLVEHLWNAKLDPSEPQDGHEYVMGVDWGFADDGDETVFLIADVTNRPFQVIKAMDFIGGDPWKLMAELRWLQQSYNQAKVIMDTTSMGGTMLKKMLKDIHPIGFDSAGHRGIKKDTALMNTKLLLTHERKFSTIKGETIDENPEYGYIRSYYIPKLESELSSYKLEDDKIKQNYTMAFVYLCHLLWTRYVKKEKEKKQINLSFLRPITHGFIR